MIPHPVNLLVPEDRLIQLAHLSLGFLVLDHYYLLLSTMTLFKRAIFHMRLGNFQKLLRIFFNLHRSFVKLIPGVRSEDGLL